jgi:hypothetical protein
MVPNGAGTWEGVPGKLHWVWICFGCNTREYGGNVTFSKIDNSDITNTDENLRSRWEAAQPKSAPQIRLVTRFGTDVGDDSA